MLPNKKNIKKANRYKKHLFYLIILLFFFTLFKLNIVALNLSNSMPVGLYRTFKVPVVNRSDMISSCLPNLIANEGLARNYLSKGKCPNGVIPVAKLVIAIPGDNVLLTQEGINVNGKFHPAPHSNTDHNGLPIKQFAKMGKHSNTQGYWLYGAHAPEISWDSRYFGAVDRQYIVNVLQPVLIF